MKTTEVETMRLRLQQYAVSALVDLGEAAHDVKLHLEYRVEYNAHLLSLSLPLATLPVQDRTIAEYPTTWWDAVKARLGLNHNRTVISLTESLVYPNVRAPQTGILRGERRWIDIHKYTAPKFPVEDSDD